jgi:hypothetical protein
MLQKIRKWFTIDHVVDLIVDILLIIWDVITSPILIVMRIVRWSLSGWLTTNLKHFVRWIAHWFERKRAWRKEKGYGIFRTYWYLIIPSPFILIMLIFAIAVITGLIEGLGIAYSEFESEINDIE